MRRSILSGILDGVLPVGAHGAGANRAAAEDASLPARAYAELRARILDLRLLPGQLLVEPELAVALGMSRTPVREALVRLRYEGLVTTVPRRGFVVSVPTVETMCEVYEIIAGVESQAIKLAVLRADEGIFDELEGAIAEQETALERGDVALWSQADRRFHELLREAAGNARLLELMRQFDGQLHRVRIATIHLRAPAQLAQSTQDHRELLAALRARDGPAARRIQEGHRERADAEMIAAIRDYSGHMLRVLSLSAIGG